MLARRFASAKLACERTRGKTRLGLGDVGAGDLADIEAVARLAELLLDDLDVVALDASMAVSRSTFI